MTELDAPSPCPEAAVLAAFVEARLDDETRAMVARHVADCSECAVVVGETSQLLAANEADPGTDASAISARRFPILTAAAVAAVFVPALLWVLTHDSLGNVRKIAAASATRTMEGRLTGFEHRRFSAPRGNESPSPEATLEAERLARGNDLHARGVAELVAGNAAGAVVSLRAAAVASPRNAKVWSDLAAAQIALSARTDERVYLQHALSSAERSVSLSPSLVAAHFNRAVAAEHLGRRQEAVHSYRRALELEPSSSPWAAEIRARLDF